MIEERFITFEKIEKTNGLIDLHTPTPLKRRNLVFVFSIFSKVINISSIILVLSLFHLTFLIFD